jgi:hypothetical protein
MEGDEARDAVGEVASGVGEEVLGREVVHCRGITRKIRMVPLTRERVLNTFKHSIRT